MKLTLSISALQTKDIPLACAMLQNYLPEELFKQTIYSCGGYPLYLQASCKWGNRSPTLLIGAYDGDVLAGYAEWRRSEQMYFLNNLVVAEAYRSNGIGGRLIESGEDIAQSEGIGKLALDVFKWNEEVHQWYQRLGFVEKCRTYWYEDHYCSTAEDKAFIIEDYPMAEAHHLKYGFSAFKIRWNDKLFAVGRIRDDYFRLSLGAGDWEFRNVLAEILHEIDPGRRLLLLSAEPCMEHETELVHCQTSIRLMKEIQMQIQDKR